MSDNPMEGLFRKLAEAVGGSYTKDGELVGSDSTSEDATERTNFLTGRLQTAVLMQLGRHYDVPVPGLDDEDVPYFAITNKFTKRRYLIQVTEVMDE